MILKKIYYADISNVLSSIKNKNFNKIQLDLNNLKEIEKLPKTDYSIALEILERVQNPKKALLTLIKRTDKKIIFSIHNTGFIGHRLRLLFGSFPLQWRLSPEKHLRFWVYRDIKWWLKELKLTEKSEIILYERIPILNKI